MSTKVGLSGLSDAVLEMLESFNFDGEYSDKLYVVPGDVIDPFKLMVGDI